MSEERTVKNITLTYEDGSTEVVEKGLVLSFTEHEDGNVTAGFNMLSITGKDLYMVVMAMMQLGDKMGFFDKEEDNNV